MNLKEFKKAVRSAKTIYGYIRLNKNEGEYIQLIKKDVLDISMGMSKTSTVDAKFTRGILRIN